MTARWLIRGKGLESCKSTYEMFGTMSTLMNAIYRGMQLKLSCKGLLVMTSRNVMIKSVLGSESIAQLGYVLVSTSICTLMDEVLFAYWECNHIIM